MLKLSRYQLSDYKKDNASPVYANTQLASNKSPLYFQYDYGTPPPAATKLEAVRLDNAGREVSRTILVNFVQVAENSYISDTSAVISPELDENCVYYLEFENDNAEVFKTNIFVTFRPPSLIYSAGQVVDKETGLQPAEGLVSELSYKVASDRLAGVANFEILWGDGSAVVEKSSGFNFETSRTVAVDKVIDSAGSYTAQVSDNFDGDYEIPYSVVEAAVFVIENYEFGEGSNFTESIGLNVVDGTTGILRPGDGTEKEITGNTSIRPDAPKGSTVYFGLLTPENWTKVRFADNGNITQIEISKLVNVEDLRLTYYKAANIDFSGNTALKTLEIVKGATLESIDLSANTAIENLKINANLQGTINTSVIDASGTATLKYLDLRGNSNLTGVNMDGNTALEEFTIGRGGASNLDLGTDKFTNKPNLRIVNITNYTIDYDLDITNNSLLESFKIRDFDAYSITTGSTTYNNLISLYLDRLDIEPNLLNMPALETLNLPRAAFSALDLSGNSNLINLSIGSSNIAFNDIVFNTSDYPPLESLSVGATGISTLDISNFPLIQSLSVNSNGFSNLSDITFGDKSAIDYLDTRGNSLTSLDLTGFTAMTSIRFDANSITTLAPSNATALQTIRANNNSLTDLPLTGLVNLTTLYAYENSLTALTDLADATALQDVDVSGNSLAGIDFTILTNLQSLNINLNNFTSLSVAGLSNLSTLNAADNDLSDVTNLGDTNIKNIDVSGNAITNSAYIDALLEACVNIGNENGSFDSSGDTNAAPSATGQSYIDTLTTSVEDGGLGWTVNTNE